jgi:hypothetical protein
MGKGGDVILVLVCEKDGEEVWALPMQEEVEDGEAEDESMKACLVQLLAGPETLRQRR